MADYKKMYTTLFNKITQMIDDLEEIQQQTEEMYIEEEDPPLEIAQNSKDPNLPR
ncbi:hypothetical protein [Pygmaiobacter massiliensis]|uniref:hypothetical protein n=1 Tax=Pygmaiobacter massiliensis TaxID=1917873 RepID=UPI00289773E4|nr:hypothetical protein [Pygmaiobacter massiliensis]MDY4783776.1 hypothetical protein [Pygmaiobacter massiliensis]